LPTTTKSFFYKGSRMDFRLSPQQEKVYEEVGALAKEKFAKRAAKYDRDASTPIENLQDLFEGGHLALTISEDLGGAGSGAMGKDPLLYLLAVEQTASACMSTAQCLHIHAHGCHYVDQVCTPEQRKNILTPVIERGALLNATGSEPGRTSRGLYKLITEAERVEGGYRLNGVKNYATLGAEAEFNIVFAGRKDIPPPEGHIGVAIPKNTKGFRVIDGSWDPMGMRGATSPNLELDNCFVSDDYVLGEPGVYPNDRWQARFHLGFAAQYLGGAEGVYNTLIEYLPKRGTSGDSYTQLRLGEICIGIDSVRWMIYRAAWLWSQGDLQEAELYSMKSKHRAIENAVIIMNKAAQIAGSSAFLADAPLSRFFRDLRIHTLHENMDRTAATVGQAALGLQFDTTARL